MLIFEVEGVQLITCNFKTKQLKFGIKLIAGSNAFISYKSSRVMREF
jgi:hypothetical protein